MLQVLRAKKTYQHGDKKLEFSLTRAIRTINTNSICSKETFLNPKIRPKFEKTETKRVRNLIVRHFLIVKLCIEGRKEVSKQKRRTHGNKQMLEKTEVPHLLLKCADDVLSNAAVSIYN